MIPNTSTCSAVIVTDTTTSPCEPSDGSVIFRYMVIFLRHFNLILICDFACFLIHRVWHLLRVEPGELRDVCRVAWEDCRFHRTFQKGARCVLWAADHSKRQWRTSKWVGDSGWYVMIRLNLLLRIHHNCSMPVWTPWAMFIRRECCYWQNGYRYRYRYHCRIARLKVVIAADPFRRLSSSAALPRKRYGHCEVSMMLAIFRYCYAFLYRWFRILRASLSSSEAKK